MITSLHLPLHPTFQLTNSPASDIKLRLRITDSFGSVIAPDDARRLVLTVTAKSAAKSVLVAHIGIPSSMPWVDFVMDGAAVRPFVEGDYRHDDRGSYGHSWWAPGIYYLGDISSGSNWPPVLSKLASMGIPSIAEITEQNLAEWNMIASSANQEIALLSYRMANAEGEEREALATLIRQQEIRLDACFHGLSTIAIGPEDIVKKAIYQDGRYILSFRRYAMKEELSVGIGEQVKFFINAHIKCSTPVWPPGAMHS
ncbi:MAG: hypothetical protein HQM01_10080, partial [Magnetococcales bacterium]|nr:hypothetical protein [Magnetococcales bacterium]